MLSLKIEQILPSPPPAPERFASLSQYNERNCSLIARRLFVMRKKRQKFFFFHILFMMVEEEKTFSLFKILAFYPFHAFALRWKRTSCCLFPL